MVYEAKETCRLMATARDEQEAWQYERGEGRYKHCWKHDCAGFEPSPKGAVGKCHASITDEVATELLRRGIPYHAPGTTHVEHVYAVYRGVVYEAAPTRPGVSFHGYPWRGDQNRHALPPRIRRALEQRSRESGHQREFQQWMREYS